MEPIKTHYSFGLTFDDILLLPGYSDFSRSEINLSTNITKKIKLSLPFVSSPMDTVTESNLAIALAKLGGIGIIHRNLSIENQAKEVEKVKDQNLLVGAAIGTSNSRLPAPESAANGGQVEQRMEALVKAGVDVVVVDSAHGFAKPIIDAVRFIKNKYTVDVIAGNIATFDGAKALIEAGADGLRVGMGPGAICTTRIISGMGVPQITAITETVRAASSKKIPIIADGGIKYSGDIVKALAAGASTVMMGSFFAAAEESPGEIVELTPEKVPHRFRSIFHKKQESYTFKEYRGMGSIGAMKKGTEIKSEGEFHGKDYSDRVLVAEGVEGLVPVKGTIKELVDQALGGIKSGMYYVGAKTIDELWEKAKLIQITQASLTESHPHDVLITNAGENY